MSVDVAGLREVEERFGQLAPLYDQMIAEIAPDWLFYLVAAELGEGREGSSYVTSDREETLWPNAVVVQAERLETVPKGPSLQLNVRVQLPEDLEPGSVDSKRQAWLAELAPVIAKTVAATIPDGWGFALLLFNTDLSQRIYVSDMEREGIGPLLRELAETKLADGMRPPGVLGREN